MEKIKHYPIRLCVSILLLLLALGACKKDKTLKPPLELKVKNYYPNSGMAGTLITIEGEGFSTDISGYSATISGKPAEVVSANPSFLVLRAPADVASGNLEFKYQGQTFQVGMYTYQELSLQKIFPINGPVGTNIRISGTGFGNVNKPATVMVNGMEAIIVSLTDTLIIATVPEKASTGPVSVKVADKSSLGPIFKVQSINEILPKTGGKGSKVTIKGTGFEKDLLKNRVTFNGKVAQVLEASEEQLLVQVPDDVETGIILLEINNIISEGPIFTVVPKPTINYATPLSGLAGTEMTIYGTDFSNIVGETKVFINQKEVAITSITNKIIKLIIPTGLGTGKIVVSVNGQIADGPVFTDQALGIIKTEPESGAAGMEISIFGTGFSTQPTDQVVTFDNVPAQVTFASTTQLKVIVPAGAATGLIKVRVNGQEAVSSKPFAIQSVTTLTKDLPANISSITVGLNGDIYATAPDKNQIIKINVHGTVTLFAGSASELSGNTNGLGTAATFNKPIGITADHQGNLYVVEKNMTYVRKITPAGLVSTFANNMWLVQQPTAITIDQTNRLLYVYGTGDNYSLVRFKLDGDGRADFGYQSPSLAQPNQRIGVGAAGEVYYVSYGYPYSNTINSTLDPSIKIGSDDELGFQDGDYSIARFNNIYSIVVNHKNQLLIADFGNNALRLIDQDKRKVSTLFKAAKGYLDGSFSTVKFGELTDLAVASDGSVYVLDKVNKAIRKVAY